MWTLCSQHSSLLLRSFRGRFWIRWASTGKIIPAAFAWHDTLKSKDKTAIIDVHGAHSFESIQRRSFKLAEKISEVCKWESSTPHTAKHVTFLCPNDSSYVVTLLACWINGATAIPLSKSLPVSQLEYYIKDGCSSLVLSTEEYSEPLRVLCSQLGVPYQLLEKSDFLTNNNTGNDQKLENTESTQESTQIKKISRHIPALIIYTSGTTGPPKGVVLTHGNINSQTDALVQAWQMSRLDTNLHSLPLHHLHGILNALLVPLSVGGTVHMMPKFDAFKTWELFTSVDTKVHRINTFMAVPTMYVKLLEVYEKQFRDKPTVKEFIKAMCREKIRLMVSGSSALPQPVFDKWEEVTGHRLLERFGMTEIGMALSNPLNGQRKPGFVGTPLPKVKVCIAKQNIYSSRGYEVIAVGDEHRTTISKEMEKESGELYVQGPNVFKEYWKRPDETKATFTSDGWFKTGDVVQFAESSYKILGRQSVDIIKSGGFKISALDVERHLLAHENIAECAVVGLADITWGQTVAAIIVCKPECTLTSEMLREWCKTQLPPYSIPSVIKFIEKLPRSPIGKVNKKDLLRDVFNEIKS